MSKDPVPILVSAPPGTAASEIMSRIKGCTARKLFDQFPPLKKRYWGRPFWARGYFCVTGGEISEEMIKDYLEHHFEPSPDDHFRTERSPRVLEPYPDFQSLRLTHQLLAGGCLVLKFKTVSPYQEI